MSADLNVYPYPVYRTRDGGLVRWLGGRYIFIQAPKGRPDLRVGDPLPEGWEVTPANDACRADNHGYEEPEEREPDAEEAVEEE